MLQHATYIDSTLIPNNLVISNENSPQYTNLVKASSQTTKVTSDLKLKRVIQIDATTVRAEYLANANSNVDLAALRNSMLENQNMQDLDFTRKFKV